MKTVTLHVTGASYELGDLAAGKSKTKTVKPKGESSLEVQFTDSAGRKHRIDAGGYFESGYRGSVRVEIKEGQIDRFEDKTRLW